MKKILITGGGGDLATEIIKANEDIFTVYNIAAPTKEDMDITSLDSVTDYMTRFCPDIVIHAGAYTRPMRKHETYPDVSVHTNIVGTANVVLSCMSQKCKVVYISTDYVYPGTSGDYNEGSLLSPYIGNDDGLTKYGWSKLGGECAVRMYDNSLILRVCICNDPFPHTEALVDVKKSLLFNHEAAKIILSLLDEKGIINVGGKAQSVYDFAKRSNPEVKKIKRKQVSDVDIAPNTSMDLTKMNRILKKNEK